MCFWTFSGLCMMVQRFLVPTFVDKNFNGCLRNTLAACFAFASEFETFMVQLRFPGCAWCFWQLVWLVFQQQTETNFSAKLRLHFSGSCMSFYNNFVEKKNVFGICEKFEMVLERLWWIQHMWIHPNGNGQQFECEWMRIHFCFSAATAKTAKLKQERHNTVHGACQTDFLCRFVFLCGKESSDWCSASRCFWGFVFCLNTRRGGGRPHCVCERLVVVIRSVWIFANRKGRWTSWRLGELTGQPVG